MPNPNGGNMTGNAGNGYVRITWSGVSCASALTPVTVTINPVPVISVNSATVCAGQAATLTATSTVPHGLQAVKQAARLPLRRIQQQPIQLLIRLQDVLL
jgi:hypothetical protein